MKKEAVRPSKINKKAFLFSFFLLFGLFVLDQITKNIALHYLALGESKTLFETKPFSFFFTLVTNTGAAWGAFALSPKLLLSVRIVVVITLSIFWSKINSLSSKLLITTIIAGALANMLDFFLYGAVIDFLHFRFWEYNYPIFNVADSAIFIGTLGLMWRLLKKKEG